MPRAQRPDAVSTSERSAPPPRTEWETNQTFTGWMFRSGRFPVKIPGQMNSGGRTPDDPDRDRPFATDHLDRDLRGRSVRGAFVTLTGQGLRFVLQFATQITLARLLVPDDFGLVGMVMAVTGFILLFKDLGLSMATVQKDGINHRQVSTLFWINVAASVVLMAVVAGLAPAIAWWYGEPRLTGITMALAGGFLLGGLAVQHVAILRRQMRFRALAAVDVGSQALGFAVGVGAALAGAGYWALVASQLTVAAGTMLLAWVLCGWIPGRPERGVGTRPLLRFGGGITVFSIVNYIARNLDNVLIGKVWGAAALGQYGRAYGLLMLPLNQVNAPVSGVAIPALSRLQNDPDRFRRYYLGAVRLIALVTMPAVAVAVVLADELVVLILGPQWAEAGRLLAILAIAAWIQPVFNTAGWLFVSLGRTGRMARWGVVSATVIVTAFLVGLPWGARGVATAYVVAIYILAMPGLWYAYRGSPVRVRDTLGATGRAAGLSWALFAAVLGVRLGIDVASGPARVALGCTAALVALGLLYAAWPGLRAEFRFLGSLIADQVRAVRPRPRSDDGGIVVP